MILQTKRHADLKFEIMAMLIHSFPRIGSSLLAASFATGLCQFWVNLALSPGAKDLMTRNVVPSGVLG